MQNYNYSRSIVSPAEIEALREVIFERVRKRAESLAKDTQDKYTSSFKEELMDVARKSFDNPANPFMVITETEKPVESKLPEKQEEIGFKQKVTKENVKEIIKQKEDIVRQKIAQNEVASAMNIAGTDFENTQKLTGALQFLNAQAGIYMANKRKASFEALA